MTQSMIETLWKIDVSIAHLEVMRDEAKEHIETSDYRETDWKTVLSEILNLIEQNKKLRDKLVLDIKMSQIK